MNLTSLKFAGVLLLLSSLLSLLLLLLSPEPACDV